MQRPRHAPLHPAGGLPALKDAIVTKTARDSGYVITANQVLVSNGGKQALYNAFATLLDPGDEVLLPAPYWTTYPESIQLAGAKTVVVPTTPESGYLASVADLEAALTPATKALVFVSPSNPTGAVYPPEQVAEIGRWAAANGLWVITDEIHEHLVYGDAEFASMPVVAPEVAERCIVVNGVAKTYAMTGWRVGWMIAPGHHQGRHQPAVARHQQRRQRVPTCRPGRPHRRAGSGRGDEGGLRPATAHDRRTPQPDPRVACPEPHGAFYAYPQVSDVFGTDLRGRVPTTSAELAEIILDEVEVAVVPGEAFGTPGFLRLSYALSDADLAEGVGRIADLLRGA